MASSVSDALRLPTGAVDLDGYETGATPRFRGGKAKAQKALQDLAEPMDDLQERLYANGIADPDEAPSLLLVLQGMDTSGKSGVIRHCAGLFDPQGLSITAFKQPTPEELEHDFLWRVRPHAPKPGYIAIFDRSHYEDVLIAKVRELSPAREIKRRYGAINDFEAELAEAGTAVVKCFLHISKDTQRDRLEARLDDPTKHWKYNPGDIGERRLWPAYRAAYEAALELCNTEAAPWYVIPSDRKWYRNWAITTLLREHIAAMDVSWPAGDFDVDAERARLRES